MLMASSASAKGHLMGNLHIITHPLIQAKLTRMRDESTPSAEFRTLLKEITLLMGFEVTRDLPTMLATVQTPLRAAQFPVLKDDSFTLVPILRAGLGMVDGFLELMPFAHVGHIGLVRDERTHLPQEYYFKMPKGFERSNIFVLDPMLATGGSAVDAITSLKRRGCEAIRMVNLVAAPQGIQAVQEAHPEVDIYVAAVDEGLNEDAYIVPGLGDAGDRIFNTV